VKYRICQIVIIGKVDNAQTGEICPKEDEEKAVEGIKDGIGRVHGQN
jgi:hypothetical protein